MVGYFEELVLYNKYIEKLKITRLKNINLLSELPFYEELNVIKTNRAFRGYATRHKVKLVVKKDPLIQLEASQSSIKDLFNSIYSDLLIWSVTETSTKENSVVTVFIIVKIVIVVKYLLVVQIFYL